MVRACSVAPELVDDLVRRDRVVRVDEQQGEQGALLERAEWQAFVRSPRLELSQDAELHDPSPITERTPRPEAVARRRLSVALPTYRTSGKAPDGAEKPSDGSR